MSDQLSTIPLKQITVSSSETQKARRKRFDQGQLRELTESIRAYGVLQPIILRPKNSAYELVAGERRYLAAGGAGLKKVPAVVRELTDEQVIEVQLIENLQRADVHPMEEAEGYHQLMQVHGHPVDELHARVGKSRSYVYGRLKLLALCKQARAAFYEGEISASVALLIARIPVEKLQREALDWMHEGMSYRSARDHIQHRFMLRLKDAPFPTDAADLVRHAGACGTCPKRTGNQPELFADVSSADVCTDPTCYAAKTKASGDMNIAAAQSTGKKVITGKEARKIAPHGASDSYSRFLGYTRVDRNEYRDEKSRKVRTIIGKGAETALLQCPETGRVIEVVKDSILNSALRKGGQTAVRDDGTAKMRKKPQTEKKFRAELYARVREKLKAPSLVDVAKLIYQRLDHDTKKLVAGLQGWEPTKRQYGSDYGALEKNIDGLKGKALQQFLNDCIYAPELQVFTWSMSRPELLLAAAKSVRVDAAAVRRSVTAKKKAKKKASTKKRRSKK